ncbi:hypothetical protein SAMN02745246_00395 [Leeuwenhoekiella marinoflava DSM 3653]|uniref:Uncharacterized protein n=2 Tax=Leeuwenhoekiella marinoflava TaxID=988 RepID=A0A4Q0PRG7_9FLAO|nr:hypothetical protein DSL99_336 [Leeuwenhoekiella marinoflava]SHE43959.1 hypothetical protein SAMN02745246_00395 [Leeuwenhoekiella marinoflava DSM 3653]
MNTPDTFYKFPGYFFVIKVCELCFVKKKKALITELFNWF